MNFTNLNDIVGEIVGKDIFDEKCFIARATIISFDTDVDKVAYPACPMDNCKKKVYPIRKFVPELSRVIVLYNCSKCKSNYFNFKYRYMLKAFLVDESETQGIRFTLFDETAHQLLGISALELLQLYRKDICEYYSRLGKLLRKTFIMKLRAKMIVWEVNNKEYFNGIIDKFEDLDEVLSASSMQQTEKCLSQENHQAE